MARVSKVVACMFCDEVPCVCNKPASKAPRKPAVAKAKPDVVETVAAEAKPKGMFTPSAPVRSGPFANFKSPTEQLAERAAAPIQETAVEVSVTPRIKTDTERFGDAIRVLLDSGMVKPEEERRLRPLTRPARSPELDARIVAWKKANR